MVHIPTRSTAIFAKKIEKALSEGDSEEKKLRKLKKALKRYFQSSKTRKIALIVSVALGIGVLSYFYPPSRHLAIRIGSKCVKFFKNLGSNTPNIPLESEPCSKKFFLRRGFWEDCIIITLMVLRLNAYNKEEAEIDRQIREIIDMDFGRVQPQTSSLPETIAVWIYQVGIPRIVLLRILLGLGAIPPIPQSVVESYAARGYEI